MSQEKRERSDKRDSSRRPEIDCCLWISETVPVNRTVNRNLVDYAVNYPRSNEY